MEGDVLGNTIPEEIKKTLFVGETQHYYTENRHEQSLDSNAKSKVLIVTNQRLLYYQENKFGYFDSIAFAFASIDYVVYHAGLKAAELIVKNTENAKTVIDWLSNEDAEKILTTLQSAMNEIGTIEVSLTRKKSIFSGDEWVLKKPTEYLTKSIKAQNTKTDYVDPLMPPNTSSISSKEDLKLPIKTKRLDQLDQETIHQCLQALKLLRKNEIISEETYRELRLPLLDKLDI